MRLRLTCREVSRANNHQEELNSTETPVNIEVDRELVFHVYIAPEESQMIL